MFPLFIQYFHLRQPFAGDGCCLSSISLNRIVKMIQFRDRAPRRLPRLAARYFSRGRKKLRRGLTRWGSLHQVLRQLLLKGLLREVTATYYTPCCVRALRHPRNSLRNYYAKQFREHPELNVFLIAYENSPRGSTGTKNLCG